MEDFDQAKTYDSNSAEQREDGVNLINLLAPQEGDSVLDLGCGTGYLTKALANEVGEKGKVIGTDPDSDRLNIAKKKYPATNVTYLEGSGENIPGGNYDIVFSNSVLHWCKDKHLVFSNIAKSLKKGGKLGFVALADYDVVSDLYTPAEMFTPECHKYILQHIHPTTSEIFKHAAIANGFEVTYYRKHVREWKFDNVSKLVEFHMTHYGKGKFGAEHFDIAAMIERYGEGSITFKMPYITVLAMKI